MDTALLHGRPFVAKPLFNDSVIGSINFSASVDAVNILDRLGYTFSNNSQPGWYFSSVDNKYHQGSNNTPRICANGITGKSGLLIEGAATNDILYSSEDNAAWTNTCTYAAATSIINGKTARKLTTSVNTQNYLQNNGTFGSIDQFYVIVERGTASSVGLRFYDATAPVGVARADFTFATNTFTTPITTHLESYGSRKLLNVGPNGGEVWLLWIFTSGTTVGHNRRITFFPSTTENAAYSYLHHAQLVSGVLPVTSPIVTTSVAVTRGYENLHFPLPSLVNPKRFAALVEFNKIDKRGESLYSTPLTFSDGAATNVFGLCIDYPTVRIINITDSSNTTGTSTYDEDANGGYKFAFSCNDESANGACNGNLIGTIMPDGGVPNINMIGIGSAFSYNVSALDGIITKIRIFPDSLSDAELVYFTS